MSSTTSETRNSLVRAVQHLNTESFLSIVSDPGFDLTITVDEGGYTLIHEICLSNILQKMMLRFLKDLYKLFEARYKENAADEYRKYANLVTKEEQRTALHIAVQHSYRDVIEFLINELNADIDTKNVYGHNILHISAMAGHVHLLITLLKEKNMNIDAKDKKGRTALHLAAHEGQTMTTVALISL